MSHRLPRAGVLLGCGLALLLGAWLVATRPFSAPDEPYHYLRAAGLSEGQLLGPRVPWVDPSIPPLEQAWATQDSRGVRVPARLSPPGLHCTGGLPAGGRRACVEPTYTGDYNPLPYALPAVAIAASNNWSRGGWLSRLASAAQCGAFLLLAGMLLWDGTLLSVLGLLAAIPPMVLFVSAVINPNGLEIAAAIAFAAALLRVTRAPAARWIWVALAVSGAVTILSWQLGPAFVVLESLVVWGLGPHEHGDARILAGIRAHWLTLAVLACSFVAYMAWGAASGLFHSAITITPLGPNLLEGVRQMKDVLFQSVGVFGRLTVTLPTALYWVWFALVATLGTGAMIVGDRRQRVTLSGSVLLAFAFPVLFQAWAHHGTGFSMQGRYVLPLLGLVPMVSGEILVRRAERLPATVVKRVTALLVATIGAFQVFAWWTAASTAAGFAHAAWFLRNPLWHPPLTWWPWVILALCGGLAFAAAGQRWRPVLPALRTRAGVSS